MSGLQEGSMGYHVVRQWREGLRETQKSGSVLILTIIISSVLFSIGISLASILQKETARQLFGLRSAEAIAIANTAFECTLYNDFNRFAFFTTTSGVLSAQSLDCGEPYPVRAVGDWSIPYVPTLEDSVAVGTGRYTFVVLQLGSDSSEDSTAPMDSKTDLPCAQVTLQRRCVLGTTAQGDQTICSEGVIESLVDVHGYAFCSEGDREERRLVRRFRVYY